MSLIFLFIIGLAVGSFLNELIDRLPNNRSIMGRSHCDFCKKTLEGIDLIPVVSFLMFKGRCRRCKKKLSIKYPLIELLTAITFVLVWLYIPTLPIIAGTPQTLGTPGFVILSLHILYLGIFSCLIAIFFADLKYQIIPDQLQIALLVFSFLAVSLGSVFTFQAVLSQVIMGFGVMAFLLLIYLVTRGRGMGFGDVKLSFIMGYLLGLDGGYIAMAFAFIFGSLIGVWLLISRKKNLESAIAFGPFLVLGIIFALFAKEAVLAYIHTIL